MRFRKTAGVMLVVLALLLGLMLFAAAHAESATAKPVPKQVSVAAERLHCTRATAGHETMSGLRNNGVACMAHRPNGERFWVWVMRYDDGRGGLAFWRWLIDGDADGWVARRGHIIVVQGGGPGEVPAYSKRLTRWAAVRVGARLLPA